MIIKILGTGCEKCDKLYTATEQAIKNLGIDAEIEKVEDLMELVRYGVMTTPALMIDGKVVSAGRVLKTADVEKLLKK